MKVQKPVKVHICKSRGLWYMHYTRNGKRVKKSLGTKLRGVAQILAQKHEQQINSGLFDHEIQQITLQDFWNEFFEFSTQEKRPKTCDNERKFWKRFQEWLLSKKIRYLNEIDEIFYRKFRQDLLKDGLKKSSVNIIHRHLSSILSYAISMRYIHENPIKKVKQYKIETKPPRYLTAKEITKLLDIAKTRDKSILMVFALGIYAGFRRNEIANARWEWFNFNNGKEGTITISPYMKFIPKNHRTRPIPLNDKLANLLKPYEKSSGYLLESDYPEDQRVNQIRYDFKKGFKTVCKKAELEWVTPHILRHTFASQLANAGVSIYKISQWLGHSEIRTTRIYAHLQSYDDEINKLP